MVEPEAARALVGAAAEHVAAVDAGDLTPAEAIEEEILRAGLGLEARPAGAGAAGRAAPVLAHGVRTAEIQSDWASSVGEDLARAGSSNGGFLRRGGSVLTAVSDNSNRCHDHHDDDLDQTDQTSQKQSKSRKNDFKKDKCS